MSLSNFNFFALAVKYDRIMNALQSTAVGAKKSRQVEVLTSILKVISQIAKEYDLSFRFDSKSQASIQAQPDRSCASHLVPGAVPWNEDSSAVANVDNSNGDQFFGFLMNLAGKKEETVMLDQRDSNESQRVAT
jgi:hypothetical protein